MTFEDLVRELKRKVGDLEIFEKELLRLLKYLWFKDLSLQLKNYLLTKLGSNANAYYAVVFATFYFYLLGKVFTVADLKKVLPELGVKISDAYLRKIVHELKDKGILKIQNKVKKGASVKYVYSLNEEVAYVILNIVDSFTKKLKDDIYHTFIGLKENEERQDDEVEQEQEVLFDTSLISKIPEFIRAFLAIKHEGYALYDITSNHIRKMPEDLKKKYLPFLNEIANILKVKGFEGYLELVRYAIQAFLATHPEYLKEDIIRIKDVGSLPVVLKIDPDFIDIFYVKPSYIERFKPIITYATITVLDEEVSFKPYKVFVCLDCGHVEVKSLDSPNMTTCPVCGGTMTVTESSIDGKLALVSYINPDGTTTSTLAFIPKPLANKIGMTDATIMLFKVPGGHLTTSTKIKRIKTYIGMVVGYFDDSSIIEETLTTQEEIQNLLNQPSWKIIKKISDAIYADIVGQEHGKLAAILTLASIGRDRLVEASGIKEETLYPNLATLFIGLKGVGKTEIARRALAVLDIRSRGLVLSSHEKGFVSIPTTSAAGLVGAVDAARAIVKPGKLMLYDGKLLVLDELDKYRSEDVITDLLSVLSEGAVIIEKKESVRYSTTPAIIATANIISDILKDINNFDTLIYYIKNHPKDGRPKPLFGKDTEPFLDRIDLIVLFNTAPSLEDFVEKLAVPNLEDINMVKNLFALIYQKYKNRNVACKITYEAMKEFAKILKHIKKNYIYKDGTLQSTHLRALFLDSPRRWKTILKIARALAHLKLQDTITPTHIREAFAFYLFIHTYPFIDRLNEDERQLILQLLSEFKEELGIYYDIIKEKSSMPTYETITVSGSSSRQETSDIYEIKSYNAFVQFIADVVEKIGSQKESFTSDDIVKYLIENAHKIRIYIGSSSRYTRASSTLYNIKLALEALRENPNDTPMINVLRKEIDVILQKLNIDGTIVLNSDGSYSLYNKKKD